MKVKRNGVKEIESSLNSIFPNLQRSVVILTHRPKSINWLKTSVARIPLTLHTRNQWHNNIITVLLSLKVTWLPIFPCEKIYCETNVKLPDNCTSLWMHCVYRCRWHFIITVWEWKDNSNSSWLHTRTQKHCQFYCMSGNATSNWIITVVNQQVYYVPVVYFSAKLVCLHLT